MTPRAFMCCPAKRGRGTTLRSSVVEGARAARLAFARRRSSVPSAPSTALRAVPLPRCAGEEKEERPRGAIRASEGGRMASSEIRSRLYFLFAIRYSLFPIRLRYFLFATRSFKKGRRNAGRRNPSIGRICGCGATPSPPSLACGGGKGGGRSPVGVPPRLSLRRTNATAQLRLRASWDAALAGVTRLQPVPVQRAPRRPVIVPAGRIPEAARERSANPPAGTAPAPPSGLPPEGVPE
jgi:hypothetical protein